MCSENSDGIGKKRRRIVSGAVGPSREHANGKAPHSSTRNLDFAVLQSSPLDVLAVAKRGRLRSQYVFRPWLTVLVDTQSRVVLGMDISADKPSLESAMSCLGQALDAHGSSRRAYPCCRTEDPDHGKRNLRGQFPNNPSQLPKE